MALKKKLGRTLFIIVTVSLLLTGSQIQHPVQARSLTIPDIEKEALIALYNSTDGDNWTDNTGWLTDTDVLLQTEMEKWPPCVSIQKWRPKP